MKRFLSRFFLSITITAQTSWAYGKEAPTSSEPNAQVLIAAIDSRETLLLGFALAGATYESVRLIARDLRARKVDFNRLSLELKGRQIFSAGKYTGVEVIKFSPLKVRFRGRQFEYDASMSPDQNYFAIIKFITTPKFSSALWSTLLENSAWAEGAIEGSIQGAMIGAAGGAFAGALAGALCFYAGWSMPTILVGEGLARSLPMFLLAGSGVGAKIGSLIGGAWGATSAGDKKSEKATPVMGMRMTSCDSDQASASIPMRVVTSAEITIKRNPKPGEKAFTVKAGSMPAVPFDVSDKQARELLEKVMLECKSQADVASRNAVIKNAERMVAGAETSAPADPQKPSSQSSKSSAAIN